MVWSGEHRGFAVRTFFENGRSFSITQRIFRRHFNIPSCDPVPHRNVIANWVRALKECGSTKRPRGMGRPKTVITPENVALVREAVKQSPTRSARKHATALNMSDRSVRRILGHKDLLFEGIVDKMDNINPHSSNSVMSEGEISMKQEDNYMEPDNVKESLSSNLVKQETPNECPKAESEQVCEQLLQVLVPEIKVEALDEEEEEEREPVEEDEDYVAGKEEEDEEEEEDKKMVKQELEEWEDVAEKQEQDSMEEVEDTGGEFVDALSGEAECPPEEETSCPENVVESPTTSADRAEDKIVDE